jgi:carbon storage regulator
MAASRTTIEFSNIDYVHIHGGFPMLVLTRKIGEKIQIGDGITVTVLDVKGARVRIGIDAPDNVRIVRGELVEFAEAGNSKDLEPETVF